MWRGFVQCSVLVDTGCFRLIICANAVANRRHVFWDCLTYTNLLVEGNGLVNFITNQKKLTTHTFRHLVVSSSLFPFTFLPYVR